jgi:hypothetical protein
LYERSTNKAGDPAGGGAVEYGDHLPKVIDAIPSDCPSDQVIAFYPTQ